MKLLDQRLHVAIDLPLQQYLNNLSIQLGKSKSEIVREAIGQLEIKKPQASTEA